MKLLIIIFSLITLASCSSNTISNYPTYSEHVKKVMKTEEGANPVSALANEIPDLSKLPQTMAPGFLFTMSHSSDSRLSGKFRADFNGILQLPYNVDVDVTNKTFAEVKESVLNGYRKFFQKGVESVTFNLTSKDYWVEVRGLVKKPGRYLVHSSDTLDLVINAAGGIQGDVGVDYFTANMKQSTYEYQVLLNRYFESNESVEKIRWLGGDSVFVTKLEGLSGTNKEIPFVTIIGGVIKSGKILHQKDASLFYYLEKAGGLTPGLAYEECYIFRNTKDGVKRINFSFNNPETIPVILANDTIYMNTKVQSEGDSWLQRFGQISTILSTAALLIIAL